MKDDFLEFLGFVYEVKINHVFLKDIHCFPNSKAKTKTFSYNLNFKIRYYGN